MGEAANIFSFAESWGQPIMVPTTIHWIKECSLQLEKLTNRTFLPLRSLEWYNGNDQTVLVLRRYPVLKVHKCKIWGGRHFLVWEFPPDKIIYDYKGYTEDEYRQAELLVRSEVGELVITLGLIEWFQPLRMRPPVFVWNRRWLQGIMNIEVEYTAGYGVPDPNDPSGDTFLPAPPYDVRRAATLLTCIQVANFASSFAGGVTARSLGDRSENYGATGPFGGLVQRWRVELYGDGRTPGLIDRLRRITMF